MDEKTATRNLALAHRDALSIPVRERKSRDISRQLETTVSLHVMYSAQNLNATEPLILRIAVYAAMRSEANLQFFFEAAWKHGWELCFPCMVRNQPSEAAHMEFFQVPAQRYRDARAAFLDHPLRCISHDDLAGGGWQTVEPAELDVVAVPLVAFDGAGRRLGYGGGNYDRLLPQLRPDALVAGVAFEEQRVDAVPTEPHDLPLPRIISA